jgi:pentatricopeptide repeat protein
MDIAVGTALVNMYGKSCNLEMAWGLFSKMPERNTLSWSSMVAILVHYGEGEAALRSLAQMCNEGVLPNKASYVNLLSACATMADLKRGRELHTRIHGIEFQSDVILGTALLNMYGKCGSIEDASNVFGGMQEQNTLSWNALLIACAQCGQGVSALNIFQSVHNTTVSPDNATFIGLLSACSHSGLVDDCFVGFLLISWVLLEVDHFNCVIDALGRAGRIEEAEILLYEGPFHPTVTSWITLLYACRNLFAAKKGGYAAVHGWELDPEISGPYVTLSNICVGEDKLDGHAAVKEVLCDIYGNHT